MTVLSVDLSSRSWSHLGVVLLQRTPSLTPYRFGPLDMPLQPVVQAGPPPGTVVCTILPCNGPEIETLAGAGIGAGIGAGPDTENLAKASRRSQTKKSAEPIDPNLLAGWLNHLCILHNVQVMLLDGPQAWKSEQNGLKNARVSERQLNTPAKTGLPGMVKPVSCRAYAEFCIDIYDALCRRGWKRLETREPSSLAPQRVLIESYPHAAWKSLGLKALPTKRLTKVSDLAEAMVALRTLIPLTVNRPPNHDQLQAIVGGLAGLAIAELNSHEALIVGHPPRREQGHWREGFIALPLDPRQSKVQWLER